MNGNDMKYLALVIESMTHDDPVGWWFKCSKCRKPVFYPGPDYENFKYCPRCGCELDIEPFDL